MKDDTDKDFVLSLLLDKGFHIEPIPEANLSDLVERGLLIQYGKGRATRYKINTDRK